MIARLVGKVVARDGGRAVLDVHDVGYAVLGPTRDVDAWARASEPVTVWISTDVREDAIVLYGFSDDTDRVAFERLREVTGVGPKVALALLDSLGLAALSGAIAGEDLAALSRAPGVGRKLAQRLALELKGKLPAPSGVASPAPVAPRPSGPDALTLALEKLGYGRAEIAHAVGRVEEGGLADAPVSERLRAALRVLSER
jgi:Holliday junction DNA helicase RuvA